LAAVLVAFFFFVATLMVGSTWSPIRAMAAPSAGVADRFEVTVNETADAATRANKVIFICFLLDVYERPISDPPDLAPDVLLIGIFNLCAAARDAL
jgi:hypothetical protein